MSEDHLDSCRYIDLVTRKQKNLVGIDLFVAAQVDPVEPWAAAGGTSSNNQSDLRYIIIIPPHTGSAQLNKVDTFSLH